MKTQGGEEQIFTQAQPSIVGKNPTGQTIASRFNGHTPLVFTDMFVCQYLGLLG